MESNNQQNQEVNHRDQQENLNYQSFDNQFVPNEINRWNWGAFAMSPMWGVGNKTYIALLSLVPFLGMIWIFVCGFKGNEWAWKKGNFKDIETFKAVQATWNRAGIAYLIFIGIIIFIYFLLFFLALVSINMYM